jgi:hypothetical protein
MRSGSTETPTSATDSLDEDVPLIKLRNNRTPKKSLGSSTESETSSQRLNESSEGSTEESDSSEGSQSEESSSDESKDVPLGVLASGNVSSIPSASQSAELRPLSYQMPVMSAGQPSSSYQRYLMGQQNVYAQSNYSQIAASRAPVSLIASAKQPDLRTKLDSNDSLNLTPKPQRKVLKQADSSEGSVSDESDASH